MINHIVMMEKVDNKSVHDTEQAILMAAEREFMAKGFAGARTTSIAEAAGVTHAMLHYYFRTKEKLFDRILSQKIALLKEVLFSAVEDVNCSLEDMIRNIIDRYLDFIAANPDMPRFLIGEIYSKSERSDLFVTRLREYAPLVLTILQQRIDVEAAQGICRKVDASMLMLDIISLNVFSFMAAPVVNAVLGDTMADPAAFVERRKKENFDTIMRKLKP